MHLIGHSICVYFALAVGLALLPGCGGGGVGIQGCTADPDANITPSSAMVKVNASQTFSASMSGNLTWSVNGVAGGNATVGTIVNTATGAGPNTAVYSAPATVPSPNTVTVTATRCAAASANASATIIP